MTYANQYTVPPLSPQDVQAIREAWKTKTSRSSRPTLKELGQQYNRSPHTVRNIIRRSSYK